MKKLFSMIFICFILLFSSCSDDKNSNGGGEAGNDENSNGGGEAGNQGPVCGDGKIEGDEICDGNVACWQVGHFLPDFEAICNADCTAYDTSKCVQRDASDKCGNFKIDSGEICEAGNTKPCAELLESYMTGEATCRSDCRGWNIQNCSTGGKIKTCAQIVSCIGVCEDEGCKADCKAAGTDKGLASFETLESCANSVCGGIADTDCLKEGCYDAYFDCFPNEKCGNGTIDDGEICEKGDVKPCQDLSTDDKQYQPKFEAVCNNSCSGWDTYSCVDINDLTCYQAYECVLGCADGNSDCKTDCISKTSLEAKGKYEIMMDCFEKKCPGVPAEECDVCKFETDVCKTHMTCGNKNVDKDNYEICERAEMVDCGNLKDEAGEFYESGTATAYCNSNCTEYNVSMCHKFCSCAEIQKCVEEECGGYPKSNSEKAEKEKCMEECERWGSGFGSDQHSGWVKAIEDCTDSNNKTAWDSQVCIENAPTEFNAHCDSGDDSRCPY